MLALTPTTKPECKIVEAKLNLTAVQQTPDVPLRSYVPSPKRLKSTCDVLAHNSCVALEAPPLPLSILAPRGGCVRKEMNYLSDVG